VDWTRPIDIYCERVSIAFWAEPINALTNVAFIVAGLGALWLEARRNGAGSGRSAMLAGVCALGLISVLAVLIGGAWAAAKGAAPMALVLSAAGIHLAFLAIMLVRLPSAFAAPGVEWPVLWLSANALVVGVGSFLFHTVAQPWAGAADTGPIMLFILGYFTVAMNRFAGLSWGGAAVATACFLGGMVALSAALRFAVGDMIGGSQSYFPALLALFGIGWWLSRHRDHPAGRALMQAGGVFAVSLVMRTLDGPICDIFPIGTHFAWHLLNGLVFWILLRALVLHGRAVSGPQPAPAPA